MPINDRDRRLLRAAVRLADAGELLRRAADDVIMIANDLGCTIDKRRRQVQWAARQVRQMLEQGTEP